MNIIDREGGMTIIPELATLGMSEQRFEHVRSFTDINPLREVSLVYSRHFAKYKLVELLWKEIVASIPGKLLQKDRGTIVEWK
jgi:LysR family hydrogen peroxide-inducible transcriptional activator